MVWFSANNPFVSSAVETPFGCALHHGLSTSLEANGPFRSATISTES
jgi:hypothetical protein